MNLEDPVNLIWDSTAPQRDIASDRIVQRLPQRAGVPRQRRPGRHRLLRGLPHQPAQVRRRRRPRSAPPRSSYDDGSSETVPSWSKEPRKFPDGNAMPRLPDHDPLDPRRREAAGPADPDRSDGRTRRATTSARSSSRSRSTNCVACHTGTGPNATPQGDNWKNNPNRIACGACHNNINWVTGANHPGVGGPQADDSKCKTCHTRDGDRDGLSRLGRPDGLGGSRRLSGEHGEQRADPGLSVRPGPGDTAGLVDEPAGRRAQGRLRDQLRHRRCRQQGDDQVPHPVRRCAGHVPAGRQCIPARRHRRHAAALRDLRPARGRRHDGGRLDGEQDRDGPAVSQPGGQHLHADRARRQRLLHRHLPVRAAAARRCEAGHRRARHQLPGLRQAGSSRLPEGHPPARARLCDADGDRLHRAADDRRSRPVQQVPQPAGRRAVVPQRRAQQPAGLRHRRLPLRDPVDRAHRRGQQLRRRLGGVGEEHDPRHPRRFEADAAVQLRGDGEEPEGLRHRRLPRRAQQLRAVPRSGQLRLRQSRRTPRRRRTCCGRPMPTAT